MWKISKNNLTPLIIIVGLLVIAGAIFYLAQPKAEEKTSKLPSSEEIGNKVVKYIDDTFLQGRSQASLESIAMDNELGMYKLKLKVEEEEFEAYVTKDGKFLFFQTPIDLDKNTTTNNEEDNASSTIGDFLISQDEICKEGDKPIVYFFGTSTCPHCQWEKPVIEDITAKFKDNIVFRENIDSNNDSEIFSKYSTGGYVPAIVLGCQYYRVGSGESAGQEKESNNLTALICKLTGNKPEDVCNKVQNLINQIGG